MATRDPWIIPSFDYSKTAQTYTHYNPISNVEQILDNLDIKDIEKYLRNKKLEKIKETKQK